MTLQSAHPDLSSSDGHAAAPAKALAWLLWPVIALALAAPVIGGSVFDAMSTDDATRLVQVRDLIGGQGWFDLVQYRLDPPHGVAMHWSRVIDAPIAGLILLLRGLIGTSAAEAAVLVIWPTLLLGAALGLVAWLAAGLVDDANRKAAQLAAAGLFALSAPVLMHFRTGAIDHHNAQIVLMLALAACATHMARDWRQGGLAGCAAALSLAIGFEMLPAIVATGLAIFVLTIWHGERMARAAAAFGLGLAGTAAVLAFMVLPMTSLAAPVCDAFGGPILLLAGGGGLALALTGLLTTHGSRAIAALAGVIAGAGVLALFWRAFPECVATPYAAVDARLGPFWLDSVFETMSLPTMMRLSAEKVLGFYAFPLIALGLAIAAFNRTHAMPIRWSVPTAMLIACIAVSVWQVRGAAAGTALAAALVAAALVTHWPKAGDWRKVMIATIVLSPATLAWTGLVAKPVIDATVKPAQAVARTTPTASCQTVSVMQPLTGLAAGRVMTFIDLGPFVMAATPHSVFAGPYHRNNGGNLAMLDVMTASPPQAQSLLADRAVNYVVTCRNGADQLDFDRMAPDGLAARLGRGERFDFLAPLHTSADGLSVWRVVR